MNNVFDLLSVDQTIRYLHACIGFPTKRTWLKPIKKGNLVGWLPVTAENVSKHFPPSKETKKGHRNHRDKESGPPSQRNRPQQNQMHPKK